MTTVDIERYEGVELLSALDATPDNPRWHELRRRTDAGWSVTASRIAAILGLDPFTSPFTAWWRQHEGWAGEDSQAMLIGRVLERGVVDLWMQAHPGIGATPGGLYANAARPWQMATPDAIIRPLHSVGDGMILLPKMTLQAKTAGRVTDEWGPDGSDVVPVGYRAQVLWEMDTFGCDRGHLGVLFLASREFRSYVIEYDRRDVAVMVAMAERYRRSLDVGDPPPIDAHRSTLGTVRKLNVDVVDEAQEISASLAQAYIRGQRLAKRLAKVNDRIEARIRDAIGVRKTASCDGAKVASRSVYDQKGGAHVDKLLSARRLAP
jgi:hypothetical protein